MAIDKGRGPMGFAYGQNWEPGSANIRELYQRATGEVYRAGFASTQIKGLQMRARHWCDWAFRY